MFEVKKNFILKDGQKKKLLEDATFVSEKILTEKYYDNEKFSLAFNDIWLRQRGEEFDLKIPMSESQEELINSYHEIEGEVAIREIFAIPMIESFEKDLASFGHKPFSVFETINKKYEKDDFIIDLNKHDIGDWQLELVEIKLVVTSKDQASKAEEKIYEFASQFELKMVHVNWKLIEFMKIKMSEVYEKLKKENIVH